MDYFSETYREARALIIAQTEKAGGWHHESYAHPLRGADEAPIFTDTFRKGPKDAKKVLVITSGTHGVEGFCGSAVQAQFVADNLTVPEGVAVLLIHAVNPFGFEYLRRVTHENVDLNRNFIDFASPLPTNDSYAKLNELVNPTSMPTGKIDEILSELQNLQSDIGMLSFMKVVSGGQYEFVKGVQFGGLGPTWSRQTIENIWQNELSEAKAVVQVDVHTGLGQSGMGLLMMAANDDEPHKAITNDWFGPMMVTDRPDSPEDVVLGGYLNAGMEQYLPSCWVIPVTLEYGTEPSEVVLRSLIEDNWLSNHGEAQSEEGRDIKKRIKRAFYPDDDTWRSAVLMRAREVFGQAMRGLAGLSPDMRSG